MGWGRRGQVLVPLQSDNSEGLPGVLCPIRHTHTTSCGKIVLVSNVTCRNDWVLSWKERDTHDSTFSSFSPGVLSNLDMSAF